MKNKLFYFGICWILLSACGDFLEPKSKSEFVPKEATSLDELLVGSAYPRRDVGGMNIFLGMLDDDIACAPYQEEAEGAQSRTVWNVVFSWQPDLYYKLKEANWDKYNIYQNYYTRILGANAVLDYGEDIQGTEDEKNNVKAQALALRGFFYLNLVNLYGAPYNENKEALGVPLKLNSGIEDKTMPRQTVGEVYEQILKDLLEAERLYQTLPADRQWRQDYKTSLPMVQLLLSRTYLYMENWKLAADYARKVIRNYAFRLIDLNEVPSEDDRGRRTYFNFISYASPEVIWLYGNVGDVTEMTGQLGKMDEYTDIQHSMFRASEELLACYEKTPGDLRDRHYIIREANPISDGTTSYYLPLPFSKFAVSANLRPMSSNTYARALRLSEAYLNWAEAAARIYKEQGDGAALSEAMEALNTLRSYRFEGWQSLADITDADRLFEFVQEERRRELCFEDHRWFDLRRWGMKPVRHTWVGEATGSVVYTLQEKDPSYTLPLPPEAMDLNNALEQNPMGPERVGMIE